MASHVLFIRDPDSLPVEVGTISQGISVQATCAVFMLLAWLAVLLRFYSRGVLMRNIGADDYGVLLASVFFTIYNVACIICAGVTMGDGYLRVSKADRAFNWLLVAESFYVTTMCALKVSVSIFFLRVMLKPWQRWVIYVSLGLATAINIAYFFVIVFQCGVPKGGMSFLLRSMANKCLTPAQFLGVSYTHGAISSGTDMIFAALPVAMLRQSNLRTRERVTVLMILTLAAVGGIASMVRLNYVSRLATATTTWFVDANMIAIWSAIEPGLGIIASSLATLRPLFRSWLHPATSSYSSSIPGNDYTRFPSQKIGATTVELPSRKEDMSIEDFIFHGAVTKAPGGPHQYITKEPWKPRTSVSEAPGIDRPMSPRNTTLANGRQSSKAEEMLGEDLSGHLLPRLGNVVSCEGPFETVLGKPAIPRCSSRCKMHGRHKL